MENKNLGAKVDAYHFDDDVETVTLVVTLLKDTSSLEESSLNVTNSEIDSRIKRRRSSLHHSFEGKLPGDRIDPGSPVLKLQIVYAN